MKIRIFAVGRSSKGPECELVKDYLRRAKSIGKTLGITEIEIIEIDGRKHKFLKVIESYTKKKGSTLIKLVSLDNKGNLLTSQSFAEVISHFISEQVTEVLMLIGGPNGLPADIKKKASLSVSFGRLTYPHLLFRVMLLEQIYRATTILSQHPYHKT